jgi:hypothetical protein
VSCYLDDDFGEEFARTFLFDAAAEILVSQFKFKFKTSGDICDTRIGSLLGVQFAAKDAVGFNADNHVSGTAIDGDIVTRRQFMRRRLRNLQIRILYMYETTKTTNKTTTTTTTKK